VADSSILRALGRHRLLYLKTVHVLNDLAACATNRGLSDWRAYILFAPTLRMGHLLPLPGVRGSASRRFGPARQYLPRSSAGQRDHPGGAVGVLSISSRSRVLREPWELSPGRWCGDLPGPLLVLPVDQRVRRAEHRLGGYGLCRAGDFNWPVSEHRGFWLRWHFSWDLLREYVFNPVVGGGGTSSGFSLTFLTLRALARSRCATRSGARPGRRPGRLRPGTVLKRQRSAGTPLYRKLAACDRRQGVSSLLAWLSRCTLRRHHHDRHGPGPCGKRWASASCNCWAGF